MRSIWKGHIRFLLVAIPVRIYNAIETAEKQGFATAFSSADAKEGIGAFIQKRTPKFQGR